LPSEFRFKVKWCVVKNPRGWGSKEKNLKRIFGKKHPMFLKEAFGKDFFLSKRRKSDESGYMCCESFFML